MSSQVDLTEDLDSSTAAAQLHHLTKEKYHIGMSIVEGSFATVKHCTDKQENSDFLLRVIQKASVFGHDDKILQEVEIMRMVKHGNVQSVLDYWETSSEMCMVMEPIEVCGYGYGAMYPLRYVGMVMELPIEVCRYGYRATH